MHSALLLLLAGALTASAAPQASNGSTTATASVNPNYEALDSIIDALNSHAVTTATPTDAVTRTAQGFVSLPTGMPKFTDIAVRATSSAEQTVLIPDLELEITQYINPIQTSSPAKQKRDVLVEKRAATDICPAPKTVTVIEWIDCAATPIDCPICPTTVACDVCDDGWKWVIATPTSTDPCTTTTKSCPVCPGGIEYIILATAVPDTYKYKRPCDVCPGGYEYIIADGSDCGMDIFYILDPSKNDSPGDAAPTKVLAGAGKAVVAGGQYAYSGTLVISSQSQLVISTEFPLSAAWGSVLTWDATTPTTTGDPIIGMSISRSLSNGSGVNWYCNGNSDTNNGRSCDAKERDDEIFVKQ